MTTKENDFEANVMLGKEREEDEGGMEDQKTTSHLADVFATVLGVI